jgi:uncharacterized protein (TIGR04255 family)
VTGRGGKFTLCVGVHPYPDSVTAEPDVIASFGTPPVVEVVTSVRFAPMSPQNFLAVGSFWRDEWQADFPGFELQGPYEAPVEGFAGPIPPGGRLSIGWQSLPPLPRVWMTSPGGQQVLQVQSDWFAANWRREGAGGEVEYDRWPARRAHFAERWEQFRRWLEANGESPIPNQCEVTYINHIRPVDGIWSSHADIDRIFPTLGLSNAVPARSEQVAWRSQHVVDAGDGVPSARLHVSVTPAFTGPGPEPAPIYVLELTVRGAPPEDGQFPTFGDRARRIIVESFIGITSGDLREAWGQT